MKRILNLHKAAGAMMLALVAAGCATTAPTYTKTDALSQAGFTTVAASTQAQEAKLKSLPTDRFTMVSRNGNTYYLFPDAPNNRAFVGGVAQYNTFLSTHAEKPLIGASTAYADTSTDWSSWSWFGPERRHERREARREFRRENYGY